MTQVLRDLREGLQGACPPLGPDTRRVVGKCRVGTACAANVSKSLCSLVTLR